MTEQNDWQPIETAPDGDSKTMFVVAAFGVKIGATFYNSDPVCVWRDEVGNFVRWRHNFPPTHWMPLPEPPQAE